MPAETSRAICSMIFGGIFDKFPKLRVNFCHASGSFLATLGRVEHGFNCRPDLVAIDNPNNPRDYCGRFWVDCITHDQEILNYILKMQGSKRVTLGSDYPFPLGDLEIGDFITKMNLDESTVEDIFCNSTLEWLNINKEDFYEKNVKLYSYLLISIGFLAQDYWQQQIKYKMHIDFDHDNHQFSGIQEITYYNNSPENLDKLFMHLYYNAFQPGSMMDVRSRTIEDPDSRVEDRIAKLSKMKSVFRK